MIETCNNCRFKNPNEDSCIQECGPLSDGKCDQWGAKADNPNHIVAGQVWGHPNSERDVIVEFVEHKKTGPGKYDYDYNEPMFILWMTPTWSMDYQWHGYGLVHWGENGKWLLTESDALAVVKGRGYIPKNDHQLEWVPNTETRPPAICRQLFGKMDESHDKAAIDNPWTKMPQDWKQ